MDLEAIQRFSMARKSQKDITNQEEQKVFLKRQETIRELINELQPYKKLLPDKESIENFKKIKDDLTLSFLIPKVKNDTTLSTDFVRGFTTALDIILTKLDLYEDNIKELR